MAVILLALVTSFSIKKVLVISSLISNKRIVDGERTIKPTNAKKLVDKKKPTDTKRLADVEKPADVKKFLVIYYKH